MSVDDNLPKQTVRYFHTQIPWCWKSNAVKLEQCGGFTIRFHKRTTYCNYWHKQKALEISLYRIELQRKAMPASNSWSQDWLSGNFLQILLGMSINSTHLSWKDYAEKVPEHFRNSARWALWCLPWEKYKDQHELEHSLGGAAHKPAFLDVCDCQCLRPGNTCIQHDCTIAGNGKWIRSRPSRTAHPIASIEYSNFV